MIGWAGKCECFLSRRGAMMRSVTRVAMVCGMVGAAGGTSGLFCCAAWAQQSGGAGPVVVQPGAPGQPSKTLPASTKGTLPPRSQADVEFMQGMIMHHAQAVEMTALIASHTENKDLRSLGAKISSSQSDEIKFMQRWLAARGEATSMAMPGMPDMDKSGTADGADAGDADAGADGSAAEGEGRGVRPLVFDGDDSAPQWRVDHGEGFVRHGRRGAGRGVFDFATDADNTQRAEIKIMQAMLEKMANEEKR